MTEDSHKVTCDGCGTSRTFVLGKDKRDGWAPVIKLEVKFQTVGQGARPDDEPKPIDACSSDCAVKALAKRLPALPKALPPL